MQRIVLLTLFAFYGWMLPLSAQSTGTGTLDPVEQRRARIEGERAAGRWQDRLQKVGELLEEEKWKRARRRAEGLCEEMSQRVIAGFDAHLGACVALRAVAQMATGDEDDARWDWELAQQLGSTLGPDFLAGFGDIGVRLSTAGDDFATAANDSDETPSTDDSIALDRARPQEVTQPCTLPRCNGEEVQKPTLVKKVEPQYPHGARVGGHEDFVVVMVVIGMDGRPRHPQIVKGSPAVMLTYRALEALRQWRFEPARLQGRVVPVFYTLTVNFNL